MPDKSEKKNVVSVQLSDFVSSLDYQSVPKEAIATVERSFLDTIGVAIAGSTEEAGPIARRFTKKISANNDVTILPGEERGSVCEAALANGVAAHSLDYDDDQFDMTAHPSSPIIPAILAVGESEEKSVRDAISAYVAGFEVMNYISSAISPSHYERGWHATATLGNFGAAAAVANLLNFNSGQVRRTLNIASSMPAGLRINIGSMTKPLHAGQAARNGVTAALLAEQGFTASSEAISGEHGFLDVYQGKDGIDHHSFPKLGEEYAIVENGVYVKKYPCCFLTHPAIAGVEKLLDSYNISPKEIKSISVDIPDGIGNMLIYDYPNTELQAKFSIGYTVSNMVVYGDVGLSAFTSDRLNDDLVKSIYNTVELNSNSDLYFYGSGTTIRIQTSRNEFKYDQKHVPGGPDEPPSDREMNDKFMECTIPVIGNEKSEGLYNKLTSLRQQEDMSKLLSILHD